ncbi:hypothetical protein MP638_005569 [Amoeboaphelidium occidentale]|nr:hypothetical protein MP638_005569 [Amoeboaphelidium occidentale]
MEETITDKIKSLTFLNLDDSIQANGRRALRLNSSNAEQAVSNDPEAKDNLRQIFNYWLCYNKTNVENPLFYMTRSFHDFMIRMDGEQSIPTIVTTSHGNRAVILDEARLQANQSNQRYTLNRQVNACIKDGLTDEGLFRLLALMMGDAFLAIRNIVDVRKEFVTLDVVSMQNFRTSLDCIISVLDATAQIILKPDENQLDGYIYFGNILKTEKMRGLLDGEAFGLIKRVMESAGNNGSTDFILKIDNSSKKISLFHLWNAMKHHGGCPLYRQIDLQENSAIVKLSDVFDGLRIAPLLCGFYNSASYWLKYVCKKSKIKVDDHFQGHFQINIFANSGSQFDTLDLLKRD